MKIAITGASGKTGYRISEEAVKKGFKVRQIIRKNSKISAGLESLETIRVSLDKKGELDKALKDIDALIIATGARASLDLTGPAKVDALGVYRLLESCKRVGIKRVILVSSLCTGKLFHPLNLFGLILIWKKLGENFLRNSNFEWTIIRPGGLKENEDIKSENINYSKEDTQINGSIPRRLVAQCCIDSLKNKESINKLINLESMKLRLDREQNLSFLEFNYPIFQAYDFYELNKNFNCKIQMGGSDQCGNIVNGLELVRKKTKKEILERKSNFRLNKIKDRLEVIDGQIIVYLNLDRVIEIIRQEDDPKEVLIKEFKLSEIQANSILDMRLRSLRKLEEIELKKEKNNLLSEQETLLKILSDERVKKNVLIDEIKEIKNSLKNK